MVDHSAISCSSKCSTTGVTTAVVCAILSVGWCIQKNPCGGSEFPLSLSEWSFTMSDAI